MELFDRHRVGTHEYSFSEGMNFYNPREDGRRCLDSQEMREKGWVQNDKGYWQDPVRATRARSALGASPRKPRKAKG